MATTSKELSLMFVPTNKGLLRAQKDRGIRGDFVIQSSKQKQGGQANKLLLSLLSSLVQSGDRFVVKVRISDSSAARLFSNTFILTLPDQERTLIMNKNMTERAEERWSRYPQACNRK
ncbi:hypothetical protein RND71_008897 [Anisodus tanguticus]|uniref:Uncharacterized protein n=1 Tax=Anisodus tanguticus TaxID=243964 RepID=A0AAE1SLQ4_9SOLA|nr:hypothetical protein RND71_008897 [Anisodus tanguticus]